MSEIVGAYIKNNQTLLNEVADNLLANPSGSLFLKYATIRDYLRSNDDKDEAVLKELDAVIEKYQMKSHL